MTANPINLVPPSSNPVSFCRLCFSSTRVKPLTPTTTVFGQNAIQIIDKHLSIRLAAENGDFPCALCQICKEKLEELSSCNDDGLLDEWQDEDLLEYKASCTAVNAAIRNRRRMYGEQRVVLPFHKLNDGRYKCNVCPDEMFGFISACIKHYQEMHPVAPVARPTVFNCVSCPARFEDIDELIKHREANHPRVKKRKAARLEEPVQVEKPVQLEEPVQVEKPVQVVELPVVGVVETAPFIVPEGELQYYQCIVCSAVVGSVMSLLEHLRLHVLDPSKQTAERWLSDSANITLTNGFKCPYCIEQFVESKAFYFHLNTVHNKNLCNSCGDSSPSCSRLKNHQQAHRISKGGAFLCDLCSIDFFTQAELDDHLLHHQTLIPIEADESVLPITDDCYFLDGAGNDECILSDDHQEVLQNENLVKDACTKVVEISDDDD